MRCRGEAHHSTRITHSVGRVDSLNDDKQHSFSLCARCTFPATRRAASRREVSASGTSSGETPATALTSHRAWVGSDSLKDWATFHFTLREEHLSGCARGCKSQSSHKSVSSTGTASSHAHHSTHITHSVGRSDSLQYDSQHSIAPCVRSTFPATRGAASCRSVSTTGIASGEKTATALTSHAAWERSDTFSNSHPQVHPPREASSTSHEGLAPVET